MKPVSGARRTRLQAFVLIVVVFAAGCASGRPSGRDPFRGGVSGDRSQAVIVVDHNGRTGSDITAYVVISGINRRRLGRVSMGERREFRVTVGGVSQVYLVGEVTGESDFRSRLFQLADGEAVEWNVALNQIAFIR